jgi:hypothetical protein
MTTTAPTVSTTSQGARRGATRMVIAGSLLTGTVLAAALPLLVFAGAPSLARGPRSRRLLCWSVSFAVRPRQ